MPRLLLACFAICAFCLVPLGSAAAEVDACDLTAGHPSDPNHLGPGVATAEVVTHVAIPACRAAVEREPDNARFRYQLGRVIYYWANANEGDPSEGIEHIRIAADAGYAQAQFVFGLLKRYAGDFCAAEPWTRRAANQGLKSARLAYADDLTAGRYASCAEIADHGVVSGYLDGAASQVDGYYEGLLLGALRRQLDGMASGGSDD